MATEEQQPTAEPVLHTLTHTHLQSVYTLCTEEEESLLNGSR